MKLTLDFDKKEITLLEDVKFIDLAARLILIGVDNLDEWTIKLSEKIVEVPVYYYPPYYNHTTPFQYPTVTYCESTGSFNVTSLGEII